VTVPSSSFFTAGFWRAEYDRVHVRPLAHALHAAGYRVASPEFARTGAPGGGWPGTFDDVRLAVTTVPALLGLAPSEVVLAGHSAGGHLALWAAGELVRAGTPPRGVLALAAVSDLVEAYSLNLDNGAVALLVGGGPQRGPGPLRSWPIRCGGYRSAYRCDGAGTRPTGAGPPVARVRGRGEGRWRRQSSMSS
jgi:hypothetical protein